MSTATRFDNDFWSDTPDWPSDFAFEDWRGRDLLTFLAKAVLTVAELADQRLGRTERLEWAARRIARRCAQGDIRSLLCRKVGGQVDGELGATWWDSLADLSEVLADCSIPGEDGRRLNVFVSKFGLLGLVTSIKEAKPPAPAETESRQLQRPKVALSKWVCLRETTERATLRIRHRGGRKDESAIRFEIAAMLDEMDYGVDVPGKPLPEKISLRWSTLCAKRRGAGHTTRP